MFHKRMEVDVILMGRLAVGADQTMKKASNERTGNVQVFTRTVFLSLGYNRHLSIQINLNFVARKTMPWMIKEPVGWFSKSI